MTLRTPETYRQIAKRRKGRGNCEIRPEELYEIADALETLLYVMDHGELPRNPLWPPAAVLRKRL